MLHRPVELAGIIGMWLFVASKPCGFGKGQNNPRGNWNLGAYDRGDVGFFGKPSSLSGQMSQVKGSLVSVARSQVWIARLRRVADFLLQEFLKVDQSLQHQCKILAVHQNHCGSAAAECG